MNQPIYIGDIAGLSHSRPDLSLLTPPTQLYLQPEPTNEYDARAIRVVHPAAGKCGYIPRECTESIHSAWTNGFDIECFVKAVIPGSRFDKVIIQAQIQILP